MKDRNLCFSELPDTSGPVVIVLVGPNGSGKSSIINLLGIRNIHIGDKRYNGRAIIDTGSGVILLPLVNPDEIAKAIRKQNPELDHDTASMMAFSTANEIRELLSEAMVDFGFETVGSHPSKVEYLNRLKEDGYFVAIVFVTTEDVAINIRRVKQRHSGGGHDVPTHKIASRYERTMGLLPHYLNTADLMAIYDNSEDHEPVDAVGPKLLLLKCDGKVTLTEDGLKSPWLLRFLPDEQE